MVAPRGNEDPDTTVALVPVLHTTLATPASSAAFGVKATETDGRPDNGVTLMLAGQAMVGAKLSINTITLNVHDAVNPDGSVAVHVTLVPSMDVTLKIEPDGWVQLMVGVKSELSVAVTVYVTLVGTFPVGSATIVLAGHVMVGASTGQTKRENQAGQWGGARGWPLLLRFPFDVLARTH